MAAIDAGITHVRDEVMPAIQGMDGYVGLSMLVDRTSGRCIATTAWESLDSMHASMGQVTPMRDRAAEIMGGSPTVEEWEIAVLHRDHRSLDGSCVRATWMQVDPAAADRAIDVYKMASLPAMEGLAGFCSASLMIDRSTGRAVSSVTYDSMAAMEQNRGEAQQVRSAGVAEAKAEVLEVCEFTLALAHLHVPELV